MGASLTWYYRESVFAWLLAPARGRLSPFDGLPVFTTPTEMFTSTVQLALAGGAVASVPMVVLGAFRLLIRYLPPREQRFVLTFFPAVILFYVAGAAFAYYVLLPTGLNFLLGFGDGVAVPTIRISDYVSIMTAMLFWLGVVFELPLVMFLLAKLRLVSYLRFRKFRKLVPATAFVLSAVITPTFDVINQALVALPIIVLYEIGLFLAWTARPPEMRTPSRCWRVVRYTWTGLVLLAEAMVLPAFLTGVVLVLLWYVGALVG